MTLDEFGKKMHRRATNLPDEVNRIKRKTALAVDQALVLATPVDTGRARSNWLVSLGSGRSNVVDPYAPTNKAGIGESANAQGAISQGSGEIARAVPSQDIYITNNLPYIVPLNQGHSAQAPAMFVEQAIEAGSQAVKSEHVHLDRGK